MSLAAMRRDDGTPNGLMDCLVVEAIRRLDAERAKEVSLDFAAFAR